MWPNRARTIYGLFLCLLLSGSAFSDPRAIPSSSHPRDATLSSPTFLFADGPAPVSFSLSTPSNPCGAIPLLSTPGSSTPREALDLLLKTKLPDSSTYWPNIKRTLFIENLKANIRSPLAMYQGSNTNFCGYAALSYIPLNDDPLTYTRFMLALYTDGQATYGSVHFNPSREIHAAAGTLRFKGILDIRPADQLWFLILADHFRAYLNFFFPHFHPGSEDTFWAAVNYGKFNRMIHELFGYQVRAKGSDLIRPHFHDLYDYLTDCIRTGLTYLYVNNTYLHKKNHNKFKGSFPTHFIVLTDIHRLPPDIHRLPGQEAMVDIVYWDYGGRTLRQVSLRFLQKITFGVSVCTKEPPLQSTPPSTVQSPAQSSTQSAAQPAPLSLAQSPTQ